MTQQRAIITRNLSVNTIEGVKCSRNSGISITKMSTNRTHDVANRNAVPQSIARERRTQLLRVSTLAAFTPRFEMSRTLSQGVAPVGYWVNVILGSVCQLVAPPAKATALLSFLCCQSNQTLSIIWTGDTLTFSLDGIINGTNRVVKEEQRIYARAGYQSASAHNGLQSGSPFGAHFGPVTHSGGFNPNGHDPVISPPRRKCGPG